MNKKYLVTGGAGFIGTNLVAELSKEGDSVIVVDNLVSGDSKRLPSSTSFYKEDVRDTNTLIKLFVGVDVVVHLAALPSVQYSIEYPQETFDVNVSGTLSVLEAMRRVNVPRIVFASSSAIYGDTEQLPITEESPADPKTPYALHKRVGEELLTLWSQLYGVDTTSLRFFNVYGPHADPKGPYAAVVSKFLQLHAEGKPLTITGDGKQTRDFVHVHDVVRAIISAAEQPELGNGEVLNIGSGARISVNEIARLIGGEVTHTSARIESLHTQADIQKAQKKLQWEPMISFEAGIGELKKSNNLL